MNIKLSVDRCAMAVGTTAERSGQNLRVASY